MTSIQSLPRSAFAPVDEAVQALAQALSLNESDASRAPDPGSELRSYVEHLGRIADAASESAFAGLPDVCLLFQEFLRALESSGTHLSPQQRSLLMALPMLIASYTHTPSDAKTSDALVDYLCDPSWGGDLRAEDVEMLKAMLAMPEMSAPAGMGSLDDLVMPGSDLSGLDDMVMPDSGVSLDGLDDGPAVGDILGIDGAECREFDLQDGNLEVVRDSAPEANAAAAVPRRDTAGLPSLDKLPAAVRELVEILVAELPQLRMVLEQTTGLTNAANVGSDVQEESFESLALQLKRFGSAAEAVGFAGLRKACEQARSSVLALAETTAALTPGVSAALNTWLSRIEAYLGAPGAPESSRAVIEALGNPALPNRLSATALEEIYTALTRPDFAELLQSMPTRAVTAMTEDVSLQLPNDVNPELLDGLLQELPNQSEQFTDAIQRLSQGGSLLDIDVAQRIAHTLKGAGNTVGVRGVATLTHQVEDILLALAKHQMLPSPALTQTLLSAADCIASMSEYLTGMGDPPADGVAVLQEVLDWANVIDRDGINAIFSERVGSAPPQHPAPAPRSEAPAEHAASAPEAAPKPTQEPEAGETTQMLRVPTTLIDDLLRLVGESIILTGQLHERLRQTTQQTQAMQAQFAQLRQLGSELEEFIDVKDLSSAQQANARDSRFDALEMDQYSELHTYSRRLVEAATDARDMGQSVLDNLTRLDDMLVNQERGNRETQEAVLRTRMVPVKTVFPRFQRGVRQTSRATGKAAQIDLRGGETMMDSDVLNSMVEPLMHLLRNAVDHGIETAEERTAVGKNPEGRIALEFVRDGNSIVVRCGDDGAGLDLVTIRKMAESRGLLDGDRQVSDEELKRLILRPNFTTRSQVTQTSGRGIGMDAVYTRVVELGGSLSLSSEPGRGLMVELRLPMTLISTHALLIRVGKQTVAISNRGVEQILYSDGSELRHLGSETVFQTASRAYPVRLIEAMLNLPANDAADAQTARPVILVNSEEGTTAVLAEAVLDTRDLVVKHLGHYVPKLQGIVGATILGDGSVTPVLDLPELLRTSRQQRFSAREDTANSAATSAVSRPLALVVDDSLSARRSMAQFISDLGYEVLEARDGMEAIERIGNRRPTVVLVDMEMPRMNGIELTTHLRSRSETAKLPIIMVTSRSTNKHREQAEAAGVSAYVTKPFSEEALTQHVQSLVV